MALLFTALLGFAGGIIGYFINTFGEESFIGETERVIDTDIATIIALIEAGFGEDISMVLESYRLPEQVHTFFLVVDPDGQRLYGNLTSVPPEINLIDEGIMQFDLGSQNLLEGYSLMDPTVAAKVHLLEDGNRVIVARQIGEALAAREKLRNLSLLTIFLMSIVVVTSFLISTFVVGRINQIGRTAQSIMETGDLSQRISIDSRWDDLSNLAAILNDLLAQVEKLMVDVRQVSDNIAHDLRTPLARLRSNLEALQQGAISRQDGESLDQIHVLISESDHLLATFNALLRIANIESGKRSVPKEAVDLQELVQDVEDLYRPLAEMKQIKFTASSEAAICYGDQDLLFQMIANLLDNAVKFTPEDGVIELLARPDSGNFLISVSDSGPGIPEKDREKVFTRFFRADQSRNTRGNGLGLSLVAAVVDRHGGTITLSDNDPGLRVDIRLP